MTALPKGEPRVCAPLYRRIPRRREAVRPYNRLPYLRLILALSFRASDRRHWRGNPFPAPAGAELPLPPSVPERLSKGPFRAPARVTFGRSPKSDQKVCLKPKVSRLPARYARLHIVGLYHTVTEISFCRADKRTVSASAPLPLISATVEADAPIFSSKSGSIPRSRDDTTFR